MRFQVSKTEVAADQLDWAIRLVIDHQAYVPAITLAGAAEEIIGQALGARSSFQALKARLSAKASLDEAVVSQEHLNKAKNWLKHWKEMEDSESVELELETEAIQYIGRAINNFLLYDRSCTSETPRFLNWLDHHRKDLLY